MTLIKTADATSHTATPNEDENDPVKIWDLQDPEDSARLELLFKRLDCVSDDELKHLKWEVDKHLENFRFFLDLSLKAVVLFYAIVGGILSILFSKKPGETSPVVTILLYAPLFMSLILGVAFFVGARYWHDATRKIRPVVRILMLKVPDFQLLTGLLIVFGVSFIASAGALVWLLYSFR
jgi:uncharacterized membrane protein YhaH (DUF805 family)